MLRRWRTLLATCVQPPFLSITLLSFYSGLPYSLTGVTLQAWFATVGVNIKTIGFAGLVGLPYAYKFLWAPLFDRYQLFSLGRRRSWLLILQIALTIVLALMAFGHPEKSGGVSELLIMAVALAFFSASQDIVIDAYRAEKLTDRQRGMGVALTVAAYRIAIIISGALAMAMAYYIGWNWTFASMSVLMALGVLVTLCCREPPLVEKMPTTLGEAVKAPFLEFIRRPSAWTLLLLVFFYKMSDTLVSSLSTIFLLKGMGFSLVEVATMNKVLGMLAAILGAFCGGLLLLRITLFQGLIYFGIIQALAGSSFILLSFVGKIHTVLAFTVFTENFCGGIGTAAYFSLFMSLCHKRYSATQYALLSALFANARVFVSPMAGLFQTYYGWNNFFLLSILAGIPGILLVMFLRREIDHYYHAHLNAQKTANAAPVST